MKNWPGPGGSNPRDAAVEPDEASTSSINGQGQGGGSCVLVAIGRLQMTSIPNTSDMDDSNMPFEFVTRHAADGNTLFLDPRQVSYHCFLTAASRGAKDTVFQPGMVISFLRFRVASPLPARVTVKEKL